MTSKKNMTTNRKPRRIHRNKGGRKKGSTTKRNPFQIGSDARPWKGIFKEI
jgi:hypothetical protein